MNWIDHTVRQFLMSWGYWAVLLGLLAEDAGVPVPGETVLMFASFLSHKAGVRLQLPWIIAVGVGAATLGDNLGFWLGHALGKTLIRWCKKIFRLDDTDVAAAKQLVKCHGARTVFFARYIFGLRTIAGPLAGMLDMEWREFLLFNFLGAVSWVTMIACIGYGFANEFNTLVGYFEKAGWALAAGLLLLGYFLWRRYKKKFREGHGPTRKAA